MDGAHSAGLCRRGVEVPVVGRWGARDRAARERHRAIDGGRRLVGHVLHAEGRSDVEPDRVRAGAALRHGHDGGLVAAGLLRVPREGGWQQHRTARPRRLPRPGEVRFGSATRLPNGGTTY